MAGSRLWFGDPGVPVSHPGNTGRKRWRLFLRLTAAASRLKKWRTSLRLSVLIWMDFFSAFALYATMNYITNVWNLSITHAAGIINTFMGITPAFVIVFAFFADAFLGDFNMLVLSSIAYSFGLVLLSLSTPTFFGPCSRYNEECIGHIQKVLFFTALPLIEVGMAGHKVSLASFIYLQDHAPASAPAPADAPDESSPAQAPADASAISSPSQALADASAISSPAQAPADASAESSPAQIEFAQMSGFMIILIIVVGGAMALPYIKAWSIRFGIPAICVSTATVLFLTGSPRYKRIKADSKQKGSPLTIALRVFVAAATKEFQQVTNFKQIYKDDDTYSTSSLRFYDYL